MWVDEQGYKYARKKRKGHNPTRFGRGNPYTRENIDNYLRMNGIDYKLLSNEFLGATKRLEWECDVGHVYQASWANFHYGRRCPFCRGGSLKDDEYFKKQVLELVGEEYEFVDKYVNDSTPITVIHKKCKRSYKVRPTNFLAGKRCDYCRLENWSGENNPNYNPTLTEEDRSANRYALHGKNSIEWAKKVYKKDDYKCVICGAKKRIQAHHLESWNSNKELRFEVSNGITLCELHHREFHKKYGYGFNTRLQFEDYMKQLEAVHV